MKEGFDFVPWLSGFGIAAGEWVSGFGVAWLAWRLIQSGMEPGWAAAVCAVLVAAWAAIAGVAFSRAVRGR